MAHSLERQRVQRAVWTPVPSGPLHGAVTYSLPDFSAMRKASGNRGAAVLTPRNSSSKAKYSNGRACVSGRWT